ncbi:MAG: hypothetical protein JJ902_05625 [Roseibium sp.]|nr:hypothetical protein [Roseibium sp.]
MTHGFAKETGLCASFLQCIPEGWTAYPETGGFDILLSRGGDGFQIGIEAKLRLNPDVIIQAMEDRTWALSTGPQPDCRAVLVPSRAPLKLSPICAALGITVIRMEDDLKYDSEGRVQWFGGARELVKLKCGSHRRPFGPRLPGETRYGTESWFERCPERRIRLPDYIPDVVAGDKSPVALTDWKIKAIKIAVTLEKRGFVTRQDFKHFKISIQRWIDPYLAWLIKDGNGGWVAGAGIPDFKAQHPVNYDQIAADYEEWKAPDPARQSNMFDKKDSKA